MLTPFYTSILSESEYGVTDILIQTGNFLIPLFSAGIVNSVLRFGLDDQADKACIFTAGQTVIVTGGCFLVLFYPLLQNIWIAEDYTILLLLYVLMASLHSICSSMAQTLGRVRLYAVSGILCTTLVVGLNILLLSVFRLGITGYVLSNVLSVYAAGSLIGASILMAASKLIMRFLTAPDYFEAWLYAPVLILAAVVACLGSFFLFRLCVRKAQHRYTGDHCGRRGNKHCRKRPAYTGVGRNWRRYCNIFQLSGHLHCPGNTLSETAPHPLERPAIHHQHGRVIYAMLFF